MENRKIKVGITHGDINGIGYEIILKTLEDPRIAEICTPIVYGSAKIAASYRKLMELPEVKFTTITSPADATADHNYIINVVDENVTPEPGRCTPAGGSAALAALERAATDLREGAIDVLVTCPISKDAIHGDEFSFPGHTEFLQDRLNDGSDPKAMMIMAGEGLRVALVTIHESLADVTPKVTKGAVLDSIMRFNKSLIADFGIHSPRIAVLSLNPHAGDNGVIGSEDNEIVAPAVAEAYKKFDGVLAMYHDQGLIPFKLLMAERGVNYTAGLLCVRTSPDHGTAFDIAGSGQADPQSLREAIYMALDIYRNRQREAEATANPLRKQNFDRGRNE